MKNIFLEIPNKTDDYLCLIDGSSHTIWAFLMDLSEGDHNAMCAVLSKKEFKNLPDLNTWAQKSFEDENEPPIQETHGSKDYFKGNIQESDFEVEWGKDGISAIIKVKGSVQALLSFATKKGYTKAIKKTGMWGLPWSEDEFQKIRK